MQGDARSGAPMQRKAYMHWVVRDPRAGGWLRSEFEVMSLLDSSGHIFRSHVHVTGKCPPVSQHTSMKHPSSSMIGGATSVSKQQASHSSWRSRVNTAHIGC